jgi:hypothetical protein
MKKIIVTLILLTVVFSTFGQRLALQQQPKEFYLEKSKKQKTAGFILLGVGTAMVIGGAAAFNSSWDSESNSSTDFYGFVMLAGVVADITSIPLFISAGINKRKAATLSVGLQGNDPLQRSPFITHVQPAVILRINL